MQFVQLSDTHITAKDTRAYGQLDTAAALRAAIARIHKLSQAPDFVVMTGDLVDHGDSDEYAHLRELISALPMPVFLVPGNHDHRETLREVFHDHAYLPRHQESEFLQYVVDSPSTPLRLLALDTVKPGHGEGELCEARLDWLEKQLSSTPSKPTVIMMHHPPFDTQIDYMDEMRLKRGAERFLQIVQQHAHHIERVLCGHVHRAIELRLAGTLFSVCPSTSHQIHLNLVPEAVGGYTLEPPSLRVFSWSEAQHTLLTHNVAISGWDEAISFA